MKRRRGLKVVTAMVLTSATIAEVQARNQMTSRPPPPPPLLLPKHQLETPIRLPPPPPPPPLKDADDGKVKEEAQSLMMREMKIIPPPPPLRSAGRQVEQTTDKKSDLENGSSLDKGSVSGEEEEEAIRKVAHEVTTSSPQTHEVNHENVQESMRKPRNKITAAPEDTSASNLPFSTSPPLETEPVMREKIRPPPPKGPAGEDKHVMAVENETSMELPKKYDEQAGFKQDFEGEKSKATEAVREVVFSHTTSRKIPPPPMRQTQQKVVEQPRSTYPAQPVQRRLHPTPDRLPARQEPRRPSLSEPQRAIRPPRPNMQLDPDRRMPPGQVQNQYARREKQQPQAPTWKRVWQKIERGLDGLADLEDAIAGRAQQVYTAATSNVKLPGWQPTSYGGNDDLPVQSMVPEFRSRLSPRKNVAKQPPVQMDMTRFQKSVVEQPKQGQVSPQQLKKTPSTTLLRPRGPLATEKSGPSIQSRAIERPTVTVRKIDWNDVMYGKTTKMIRANGGASVPQDDARSRQQGSGHPTWNGIDVGQVAQPPIPAPRKHAFPENQWSDPSSGGATPSRPVISSVESVKRRFPDEEESSFMDRVREALPSIPSFRSFRLNPFHKSSFSDYSSVTMDAWKLDEADEPKSVLSLFRRRTPHTNDVEGSSNHHSRSEQSNMPPLSSLMRRCDNGKSNVLLSAQDKLTSSSIAKQRALFDLLSLGLFLFGARSLPDLGVVALPHSISDFLSNTLPSFISNLETAGDTWAPIAFAAAFLAYKTGDLLCESKLRRLSLDVANTVKQQAQYGSLFLRLVSSQLPRRDVVDNMLSAAYLQVSSHCALTRLKTLVSCLQLTLVWMTFSVLRPFLDAAWHVLLGIVTLDVWRKWPPDWASTLSEISRVFVPFGTNVAGLLKQEAGSISNNPLRFAYDTSIFLVLAVVAMLPGFVNKRIVTESNIHLEEDAVELHNELTERILEIGTSSASRLQVFSEPGGIESMLERWRLARPDVAVLGNGMALRSLLRQIFYGVVSGLLLAVPLLVYVSLGITPLGSPHNNVIRWDSLFDVGVVLAVTQAAVWSTLSSVMESTNASSKVMSFLSALADVVNDRKRIQEGNQTGLRMHSSASPTAGLLVRDLWAAHTTKRAWAVRGATLECKNGEILVILGDEGSGKTKLLTTLAEALLDPPKQAQTATRVRGSIFAGGEEANKWEKAKLQRRLGIFLSDVRSVADEAKVFSGLSIEEILEPSSTVRYSDAPHSLGASEKAAVILSLKITGLYSTLMPRLPSKLSTVVTAKEDELVPSPLRPRSYLLSPSEWSKLLITRVIAQTIHENENAARKSDQIDTILQGSYLLLDDATALFSEIEESRFLRDLRRTGAATILTSSRWAIGRFADKIAVIKEGAVVEFGNHSELLSRGPQNSIYAAKWYAMTSQ